MVDLFHLRVVGEELHNFLRILRVTVQTQRQGFHALQQQEGVKRRNCRAGIAQQNGADVRHESSGACRIHKGNAVVAGVRLCDGSILAACLPVKFAGIHNDAAQGGAVAADKLGGRVDHDVRAVLDGTDQVGSAEGVVNYQGQAVLMGDFGNGVDIGDIAVGVAQGLEVDGLGVLLNGALDFRKVVRIHKGGGNAELGQGVGQQVIAAAVDGLLGDNVIARLSQSLNGVGDSRRTGSQSQGRHAALQSCQALFQYILGGVGQTAVDVARIRQAKPRRRMGRIAEYVRRRLINRHRSGIRRGIGLFLTHMQLQGFKFIRRHKKSFFLKLYSF